MPEENRSGTKGPEEVRGSGGFNKGADIFPVAPAEPVAIETVMMSPGPLMPEADSPSNEPGAGHGSDPAYDD